MRLDLITLLLTQLAVHRSFALPVMGTQSPSHTLDSSKAASDVADGRHDSVAEISALHRRSPLPPPHEQQMHTKEKHKILASNGGKYALKEMRYGVVGSAQTISSGFRQAHGNANRAVDHFKQGEKAKGVKHATIATGKAAAGVLMSPVPVLTGLTSGAVMGTYALKHKIQAARAPKERLSREDPKEVHKLAKAFKEQRPVYDWTQKMVHKVLRTNSKSPSSSSKKQSGRVHPHDTFDRSPIVLPEFSYKPYQRKPGYLEPLSEESGESWLDPKGLPQDKDHNYKKSHSFHL